ncbi:glucose-6-phosphate isomerase [Aureococcus anophagefferens]|nr:glucose-6-phosphate isomerase [Aureococcus anophagefferens]
MGERACLDAQGVDVGFANSQLWRLVPDKRVDFGRVDSSFSAGVPPTFAEETNALRASAKGNVSVKRGGGAFEFTVAPANSPGLDREDLVVVGRVAPADLPFLDALNAIPTKKDLVSIGDVPPLGKRDALENADRNANLLTEAEGIVLDYAREKVDGDAMAALFALARKANVEAKRDAMFNGDVINETEQRSVYHVALRAPKGSSPMLANGEDQVAKVNGVLDRIEDFSDRVRSGAWKGATGEALTTVLAIGIGGSYLGPEFLCEALRAEPAAAAAAAGRDLKFVANVDPVDFARQVAGLDASKTLVVIVSKSFTTAETIMNAKTVKNWLLANVKGDADAVVRQHVAAVSTQLDLTAQFGIAPENVFEFGDYVGGRFSVHSPVGMLPLALQYGMAPMRSFLAGARNMDEHFASAPLESNLPVILGLLGLYNSSFLGYECKAILPYAQALLRFAAHVQQLDMESNGKSVAMDGSKLDFAAGEVIFGEPGTNGQHSFYQLMHQGRVVPAEFIGFAKSQAPVHLDGAPLSNHDELMCNFFAQPDALACG